MSEKQVESSVNNHLNPGPDSHNPKLTDIASIYKNNNNKSQIMMINSEGLGRI